MRRSRWKTLLTMFLACGLTISVGSLDAAETDVALLLKTIKKIGPQGSGHREAVSAVKALSQADARQLPEILAGMDDAGPLASNWIRGAVEAIADRQLKSEKKLPLDQLELFVKDRKHSPHARRLAYEWLARVDATAADRLIPTMTDDPSIEFRRDAVVRLTAEAESLAKQEKKDQARDVYMKAFVAARDLDQIQSLKGELQKLGKEVNLPTHFGFLMDWQVIGPFDNTDESALDTPYPPEKSLDLKAAFQGKGQSVNWLPYSTLDELGNVDLNKGLGKHKGSVAYAVTHFVSDKEQTVEFRLGCITANKLWVNGKELMRNPIYHSGTKLDQFIAAAKIKKGTNVILLKICQNEQKEEWAQDWKFQLRVCDATGTAILSADRAAKDAAGASAANDAEKK